MAGMLHNRKRPTALEIQMLARTHGQVHVCPACGCTQLAPYQSEPPYCNLPDCELGPRMYPAWDVRDSQGRSRGWVAGICESDAMESVRQSSQYDRLTEVTVTPRTTPILNGRFAYGHDTRRNRPMPRSDSGQDQ